MTYNHKLINDLAWCLQSPSLLTDTNLTQNPVFDSNWLYDDAINNIELLKNEDKSPTKIQQHISTLSSYRLGFYFEYLLAYWFSISPRYSLIERNIIIQSETRTLGEIDFIIKDNISDSVIHLEVAIKFYLSFEHNDKIYHIGPNLKDRFDIKLDNIVNKQIKLSHAKTTKEHLKKQKIEINNHKIIIKGRLFVYSPDLIAPFSWLTLNDFIACGSDTAKNRWIILLKTHWLSSISDLAYNFLDKDILNKQELIKKISEIINERPICVAKITNDKEEKRFFITANNWLALAKATLE